MFSTLPGLLTSSIGESPVTVMVSASVPSSSTMSTWKFTAARSRIPSRWDDREARELGGDGVVARRQVDQTVVARLVGDAG